MQIEKLYHVMCVDNESGLKQVLHTYTKESDAQAYIANQFEHDQFNGFVNAQEYWIETDNILLSNPVRFESDFDRIFNAHEAKVNSL